MPIKCFSKSTKVDKYAKQNDLTHADRLALRKEKSDPVIDKIGKLAASFKDKVPPSSLLGKAINYLLQQWSSLEKTLETASC